MTLSADGTTTPVIGTETTLTTDTTDGVYVLELEIPTTFTYGDLLDIRAYTITRSGGDLTQVWRATYQNPQINRHKVSPAFFSDQSIRFTILQRGGSIALTQGTGASTIAYNAIGTGQGGSSPTALIQPLGGGALGAAVTSPILMTGTYVAGTGYTAFGSAEVVYCTTSGNQFTMNGAPNGRAFPWKLLRK